MSALCSFWTSKEEDPREQLLQGTLDLIVLRSLATMGRSTAMDWRSGFKVSKDALHLNQGTLYPALLRLEQQGWITGQWGKSENNRQALLRDLASGTESIRTGNPAMAPAFRCGERLS